MLVSVDYITVLLHNTVRIMSSTLVINGKAPVVAYAELIAARLVNDSKSDASVTVEFVDDKKSAAATFDGKSDNALEAIVAKFPEILGANEESKPWIKIGRAHV